MAKTSKNVYIILVALSLLSACGDHSTGKTTHTDAEGNTYTSLFTDTVQLMHYLDASKQLDSAQKQDFIHFYKKRNFECAWFNNRGTGKQTHNFIQADKEFSNLFSVSPSIPAPLINAITAYQNKHTDADTADNQMITTDLELTTSFFRYAQQAFAGRMDIDTKEIGWLIPRKKINYSALLDSFLQSPGYDAAVIEPALPQYKMLKAYLIQYKQIEKADSWQPIVADKNQYKKGDSSATIVLVKKRLLLTGDLITKDTSALFNDSLSIAIMRFQHRYGMREDSILSAPVISEMNVPVSKRITQMTLNLERLRWITTFPSGPYILVNIPEFRFHVYDSGKHQWTMNVVVGKPSNSTNIFSDSMETIVFSPYWNVPYSIVKNEMGRSPAYFAKRGMIVVGKYSDNLPIVRQKPGGSNSLGKVKFLFPNEYNIYFHDTPAKSLFKLNNRAFSHGCIRLAEPAKLAAYLLRKEPSWTKDSIDKVMNQRAELAVPLKQSIPVFIAYFTSWVDEDGKLNFREDIYGQDKKLAFKLLSK